jgi:hypothetical protein
MWRSEKVVHCSISRRKNLLDFPLDCRPFGATCDYTNAKSALIRVSCGELDYLNTMDFGSIGHGPTIIPAITASNDR